MIIIIIIITGTVIRLNVPSLTAETRQKYIKQARDRPRDHARDRPRDLSRTTVTALVTDL